MMKDDGTFFREVECDLWSPEARIAYCDNVGIDVQVLSTVPVMFSYWAEPEDCLDVSRFLNDHIASVVKKYPTRFIGLATIPLQAPDLAIKELRRCMSQLGFAGIQIGSHVNDWTLDDPRLFPVFQECERLGACIFVHPWDMMGKDLMKKYWLPWLVSMPAETSLAICSFIFGGIFERLPKLRVLFAHGGGSFPATVGRVQHGFDCRPDLCAVDNPVSPTSYLGRFWVDSLFHGEEALQFVVNQLGKDRVCLGTDFPFPLGECYPLKRAGQSIDSSPSLSPEAQRLILGANALGWLGVPPAQQLLLTDAPHRKRGVPPAQRIVLVGKYVTDCGTVDLRDDGNFECVMGSTKLTGKWSPGTFTRLAKATGDVLLKVHSAAYSSTGGLKGGYVPSPWHPQEAPPFQLKIQVARSAGTATGPLAQFPDEHLRRRSGLNTMLEGEKQPQAASAARL